MLSYHDDLLGHEQDSPLSLCERRVFERETPITEHTRLWVEGRAVEVQVIDASDAGIGMLIPDMPFSIGPRVQVDYDRQRRTGVVAYLNRQLDGYYRLGVEWIELPKT